MSWLPAPAAGATCLVTGASSGIGAAIARELTTRGHGVTLVARRRERLRGLADELSRANAVRVEALPCDLVEPSERMALPGRIESLGSRVDVLVNCAGIGSYGSFADLDRKRELDQVRLMCEAVVDLCGAFVPSMAARRSGAVLIVSSSVGLQPVPGYATYGGAKAFGAAFGQSLHAELRARNVAVTTACPGPVDTEFFAVNGRQPVQRVVPRALWTTPAMVATSAVTGLARNQRIVIPGMPMRASMAFARLAPSQLRLRGGERLLARRA